MQITSHSFASGLNLIQLNVNDATVVITYTTELGLINSFEIFDIFFTERSEEKQNVINFIHDNVSLDYLNGLKKKLKIIRF